MECELTLGGKNKLTFKRTAPDTVYLELSRPGFDGNGFHGWIIQDSRFLDASEIEQLRGLLKTGAN